MDCDRHCMQVARGLPDELKDLLRRRRQDRLPASRLATLAAITAKSGRWSINTRRTSSVSTVSPLM